MTMGLCPIKSEESDMKKISLLLALVLLFSCAAFAEGDFPLKPFKNVISGEKTDIPFKDSYEDNPVKEGENSFTGLAYSGDYTPIMLVLDNSERVYPHWGVRYADVLFQAPNAGGGATKILALFAHGLPEQAGPSRSARAPFASLASAFGSALVSAGRPAKLEGKTDFPRLLAEQKLPFVTLLTNKKYAEPSQYMKGANNARLQRVNEFINEKFVKEKGYAFYPRPFKFSDENSISGVPASKISLRHFGDEKGRSNPASESMFIYDAEKKAYSRINSSGAYIDRDTGEELMFSNVVVLRADIGFGKGSMFLKDFKSGNAEFFINGQYIRGGWFRNSDSSRLVLVDDKGEEIRLQRGKTFIVLTNSVTEVAYE